MTVLSDADLSVLRSRPQATSLWLSIYKPDTVLAAQVSGSYAKGAYVIGFDSITTGSFAGVQAGMTLYVGSAAGKADKGRVRVRSITNGTITVAENSNVQWADDLYLTVADFHEIWPVYPRITQSGSVTYWFKDYDIAYSDQNSIHGSFVNMGSNYAGFVGADGTAQVYFSASGTSNLAGSSLSYAWTFEGAPSGTSTVHTPGLVTYSAPGHYTAKLEVTALNGAVDTSYRHISLYQRPGVGATVIPIEKWGITNMMGSRDGGGYTTRLWIRQDMSDIKDGSLVVIFADDAYGATNQSLGGNALGRQKIVFTGYIADGTIRYDYANSTVECDVLSPTGIMRLKEGFSVAVDDCSDPVAEAAADGVPPWTRLKEMNIQKTLYHYLRWHSTVLSTCDFQFIGTDRWITGHTYDRQSMYDAVHTLMLGALYGNVVSDRQGKIWAEVELAALHAPHLTYPQNIEITRQDWMGEPSIEETITPSLSYLEFGGVAYSGISTGTFTAHMACAPGTTPGYSGRQQRSQGLALASQAQLNTLVGDVYAWQNARYPSIMINLAGNYRNLDIAPQEINHLTIQTVDTVRGVHFNNVPFSLQEMMWTYDPAKTFFSPQITLHEIPSAGQDWQSLGYDGDTITIPDIPPQSDPGDPYIPPIPPIVFPPITIPGATPLTVGLYYYTESEGVNQILPIDSSYHNVGFVTAITNADHFHVPVSGWYSITVNWEVDPGSPPGSSFIQYMALFVNGNKLAGGQDVIGYLRDCREHTTLAGSGAEYTNSCTYIFYILDTTEIEVEAMVYGTGFEARGGYLGISLFLTKLF